MSAVQPYSHEDRASTRRLIKRLEGYSRELDDMMRGKAPLDQDLVSGIHALTDTPDIENQIKALDAMVTARRRTHIEHLTQLAPDDLTAFAEVLNPNEPPAKHHIYLSDRLQEVERGDRDRLMLSMPPGHAKDLDCDTPVMMADGTWRRLGDVEVGDEVIAGTGRPQEVLAVHDQGVREVVEITTQSGRVVVAHPEHQFLTPAGWTAAEDLLPGSTLTQPRVLMPYVTPERARAEFVFAGYMVARAVVTGRSYSRLQRITSKFRCDDPAILADIVAMGQRLGFRAERAKEDVRGKTAALLRFDANCVSWLKAAGLHGLDKRTMRLPAWIFQGSDGDTAAFLGAIVSCDATFVPQVSRQTGAQRKMWLQVRNNAGLADDIARLFFRLGINIHRRVSRCTNYNYDHAEFHRMEVPSADDQALIGRRLRIIGSTKRFWAIPLTGGTWGNEAFRPDPVATIRPVPARPTRCITVEHDASFVANGIVVHNSTYCSRYYPAWYLGRKENRIYLQAGWGQQFAEKEFGRKTKDIVCSPAYASVFPSSAGVRFDAKANGDWIMGNGNRYVTKGAGEGISGFRSTNNAVDDPYKSFEQAQSPLQREKLWDWFTNDFMTRLLPQGNAFIIMCMTGDTRVAMAEGGYKRLDAVRPGDIVWAWKDGRPVKRAVLNFADQGEDDVFEIKTGHSTVRANARHPFLVDRDGHHEWVKVADLKKGDLLVTSATLPDSGKRATMTRDEAWLLGFMFGDGWLTRRDTTQLNKATGKRAPRRGWVTCVSTGVYPEVDAHVLDLFERIFEVSPKLTKYGYRRTEVQAVGLWFAARGLAGKALTKRLPAYLYDEPLEIRRAFLSGFQRADGCQIATGSNAGRHTLSSGNEDLIHDLRHLLRGVGEIATNAHGSTAVRQAPNAPEAKESELCLVSYNPWNRTEASFRTSAVRSIEAAGRETVYDIQVDDAECFIADGIVVSNTRWHIDDLIGRLNDMAARGDIKERWDYLNIPVFCEEQDPEKDPLRRNYGEEIWPDFYSKAVLLRHKEISSQSNWDCLYRGQPQPADGNVIKKEWITDRYTVPPLLKWDRAKAGDPPEAEEEKHASTVEEEGNPPSQPDRVIAPTAAGDSPLYRRTVISVDSAEKETQRSDFTAITVWRESILGHHYLVDAHIERMEFPKLVERIEQFVKQWNAEFVLMEEKGAGNQYIQHMNTVTDKDFVVVGINPGRDGKVFRMDSVTPIFMQKRVILPRRAPWLEVFERELLQFPGGKHDDYPDSVSQYLKWARDTGMVRRGSKKLGGMGHRKHGGRRYGR